jgi:uncharacterized repeat protein (TIGR01451 family)
MNLNQPATLKIVVRNTGASEAMNVCVYDELPDGLDYVSSQPPALSAKESLLTWRFSALPAGTEKQILVKVKPAKAGAYDHAATVTFQSGSKSRTRVLHPRLKVDQTASTAKVLKGQSVEFKVVVTNIGDGPARNVTIQAKLSPGLRHESGQHGDDPMEYELTLPDLAPGQHEELDPLVADAIQGGDQWCKVSAVSPDVLPFVPEEAESTKTVKVVEPHLELAVAGPAKRFTDTVAPYSLKLSNSGTAPARKVSVVATLPVSGRLVRVPSGAFWDSTSRRLRWTFDRVEPGATPVELGFEVRMGGTGFYEVTAEARGEGALQARGRCSTDVSGLSDVDLVVSERQRVVDVGGKTTFQIRLRNYGTKEAANILMSAKLSKNLNVETFACPADIEAMKKEGADGTEVKFLDSQGRGIPSLGAGKEMILGIVVSVTGPDPKMATCRVTVTHDDQSEPFEDMAGIKVMTPRGGEAGSP